jgi:hypothetical protein
MFNFLARLRESANIFSCPARDSFVTWACSCPVHEPGFLMHNAFVARGI